MTCIGVHVSNSGRTISFWSDSIDGRYAEGSNAWGWGGYGTPSNEEYKQSTAIPKTIAYLGVNFKKVYGREMTKYDICGQGEDPAIAAALKAADAAAAAAWAAEELRAKIEADKKQIELQTQMLNSGTTIWASEDVYTQSIDVVNASIDAFNPLIPEYKELLKTAEITADNVSMMLPSRPKLLESPPAVIPTIKDSVVDTVKSVSSMFIIIPVVIIMIIVILISGRK